MNKNKQIALKQKVMQLTQAKQFNEAKNIAQKLAKAAPKDVEVWFALGQLQSQSGELKSAAASFCQAAQSRSPLFADALKKAVDICLKNQLFEMGIAPAKQLVKILPESAMAHFALGFFWHHLHFHLEAESSLRRAVELVPDNVMFLNHLGASYVQAGEPEKAMPFFERSKQLGDGKEVYYLSLTACNYMDGLPEEKVFEEHCKFGNLLEERYPEMETFPARDRGKDKRIRIAYSSPDFKAHAVAWFFMPLLENHSKACFDVYCYADAAVPDAITERMKSHSGHWCDSSQMSDEQLYQRIRSDQIDILVDLAGYNGNGISRIEVFARKAAPVQVTYLGYPNTTGLSRMDYRVTDEWSDPVGQVECWHTESLMRLPGGFLCYSPAPDAPPVSALPARQKEGSVCFGSFNHFQKITPRQIKLWARVLMAVPSSTLFVKAKALHEKALCERIWTALEAEGIGRDRVELSGWQLKMTSHLEIYGKIDIHLDSHPYNGTTTTCEALWQGVPTITLAGDMHRSRVGVSLLNQVGLADYIATNDQQYVDLAIEKSADLDSLAALRAGLRERVANSPLMNPSRFVSEFEQCCQQMWSSYSKQDDQK